MTYEVSFPDPILNRLALLKDKVLAIGRGKELARVVNALMHDLTERPLEVGEVMYRLKHVPMPVISHAKDYLGVVYVVDENGKHVMVTKMKLMAGHPFPAGYEKYLNS